MKIHTVDQNSEEWFHLRKGKVTGSKLKGLVPKRGTKKKIGFYELMAEQVAIEEESDESDRERGARLEQEAIQTFAKKHKKNVDIVGFCVSESNPNIALSPDGLIKVKGKYVEAVEVKCLSHARHLEAHFEKKIPSEYIPQAVQYFIVNEDLRKLYFVFYDPQIMALPLHVIEIGRDELESEIEFYKNYQEEALEEIDRLLEELTF